MSQSYTNVKYNFKVENQAEQLRESGDTVVGIAITTTKILGTRPNIIYLSARMLDEETSMIREKGLEQFFWSLIQEARVSLNKMNPVEVMQIEANLLKNIVLCFNSGKWEKFAEFKIYKIAK